jgi:O-antigen/teichoic acid export membrane protein
MAGSGRVGVRAVGGGFVLFVGRLAYNAVSAVGSIVIARLLGPANYGVVSIALIYPLMFSGLADLGLSTAIMRYASIGDFRRAFTALWLRVLITTAFAVALIPLAPYLAFTLHRPYLAPMIDVLAIYAFAYNAVTSVTAFLAGVNRYWDYVVVDLVRNSVRVSSSIALVLAGYGVYGAVWGFSIGYAVATVYAFVRLVRVMDPVLSLAGNDIAEVLNYSIPLYIPGLLGIPIGQFYNILMAIYVTNAEMGNYQISGNLLTPIGLITGSLSTALFTTLPQLVNEDYKFRDALNRAARYTAIVVSPIAIALALFSNQAVYIVYGPQYSLAPLYLSIMAISNLLAPFGVVPMYLNIIGATRTTMALNIVSMLIGLPITWALLVHYGMLGAVIASLINGVLGTAISLIIARRMYSIVIDVTQVVKYWAPSLIAGTLTYPAMHIMSNMWLALSVGSVIYLALLIILTALMTNMEDLKNIADISRSINYVGPLINHMINYIIMVKTLFLGNSIN